MSINSNSISVLCVDDEPGLADLIGTYLEQIDAQITATTETNATDALERLVDTKTTFDCIVSDYDLVNMDGLTFLQAIRADHPDLPFILFTGRGSEEIASDAISAGVTDYMQKETSTDQYEILANRIRNAVALSRARRQATEAHERAQIILDSSPDAIFALTSATVVYANPQAIDLLNAASEDEISSHQLTDFIPIEDRTTVSDKLAPVQKGDPIVTRIRHKIETLDGRTLPVELTARHITWDGQPGVVAIVRDLSERMQRDVKFNETNRLLSTLFDMLPAGIVVLDSQGQITRANQRAEEVLGLTESDITERHYDDVEWEIIDEDGDPIPPSDLPFARVMKTGEMVTDYKHGIKWPDRSKRWLSINATSLKTDIEALEQVVAVISDITDQREKEWALRRQNKQLEEFASIVSHDLRNPLATAQGYSELAREDGDPEHFKRIDRSLYRMERIIEDVLWLAREGREIGATEEVQLEEIVDDSWELVSPERTNAELIYQEGTLGSIVADYDRLCQLLENIFGNAIKHGGQDVTVRIERIEDGFAIEDTGVGIPESIREQVFEKGLTTADDGTGFGLYIVKQIAKAHGWEVGVTESTTGGTRIEITGIDST